MAFFNPLIGTTSSSKEMTAGMIGALCTTEKS